ncbi:MAG: alkaline phosphatase D family protein, partial [Acidobacteria bacterium]|nr:alkaline phosphatase D family protein [Acidobacteriota bacterium]
DERIDERNTARKRNAERAYFEYVPVDVGIDGSGRLVIDDGVLYPNTRLYRSFRFGTNVDLFLTDTRTRRPDHLIREDAFLSPPEALLRAQALVSGNQSITFVNALFAAVGLPAPFPPGSEATFDRGLSYLFLGKQRLYSSVGSRSIVVDDSYKLLSAILYRATAGATEDLFGAEQERWLRESLPASGARVKIVGSSISATSKVLDFTNSLIAPLLPPGFPDALRTRLQVTADDWDGFPDKRRELVDLLLTASSQDPAVTPSRIAFSDTGSSGFVVMTAAADGLTATYHLIDAVESRANHYEDPDALERLFSTRSFRVQDGVLTPLP